MKRICVLLSLVIVISVIYSCGSTDSPAETSSNTQSPTTSAPQIQTSTQPTTEIQTSTPTQPDTQAPTTTTPPQDYEVITKTTINKTLIAIGENLTINTEIQYVGNESTILGIPTIIIWNSSWSTAASWFLDEYGNIHSGFPKPNSYHIEKDKKYNMNVTWDLRNQNTNIGVPSGEYRIQITISKPEPDGSSSLLLSNEGVFLITITNGEQEPTSSTIPTIDVTHYTVHASTNLSATSLSVGDTLTIQTEIEYIGEESTITGVPTIMVLDSRYYVVAHWSLDQNDNIYIDTGPMQYFQIEKGRKYLMSVTWNLKDTFTNSSLPPGQYTLRVTIAIPYENGFSPLLTNENLFITIS